MALIWSRRDRSNHEDIAQGFMPESAVCSISSSSSSALCRSFRQGQADCCGRCAATASKSGLPSALACRYCRQPLHLVCAVFLTADPLCIAAAGDRNLALLAAFLDLMSIAIEASSKEHLLAALFRWVRRLPEGVYAAAARCHGLPAIKSHSYGLVSALSSSARVPVAGYLIFRSATCPGS